MKSVQPFEYIMNIPTVYSNNKTDVSAYLGAFIKTSLYIISLSFLTLNVCKAEYAENQALPNPGWPGSDLKGKKCFGRGQGYGPFDYTNQKHRGQNLRIVEHGHFTKDVETLSKGISSYLWADIDYTLRAFPNHHRALYAMARYQLKTPRNDSAEFPPVECYFQRAMAFKPSDYRVMQLYANYLTKKDQLKMAESIYKRALTIYNVPLDINYALGILYVDMNELDKAVEQAKIVYGRGFKKTKLARKLKKANRWPIK